MGFLRCAAKTQVRRNPPRSVRDPQAAPSFARLSQHSGGREGKTLFFSLPPKRKPLGNPRGFITSGGHRVPTLYRVAILRRVLPRSKPHHFGPNIRLPLGGREGGEKSVRRTPTRGLARPGKRPVRGGKPAQKRHVGGGRRGPILAGHTLCSCIRNNWRITRKAANPSGLRPSA